MCCGRGRNSIDKMQAVWQYQDRTLDVLEGCHKSFDCAFREFSNCRVLHEAAWVDVQEASRRLSEQKRWQVTFMRGPYSKGKVFIVQLGSM